MMVIRVNIFIKYIINEFKSINNYVYVRYISIFVNIIYLIILYFLWKAIYEQGVIEDYSNYHNYFNYFLIVNFLSLLYPKQVISSVGKTIRDGTIIYDFLKPQNFYFQQLYKTIGKSLYNMIYIGLFVSIIISLIFKLDFSSTNTIAIFSFVFLVFLTYLLLFNIEIVFSLFAFFTGSIKGVERFKIALISLFSGQLVPLFLYPDWSIRIINSTPLKYIYYYPIQIFFGNIDISFSIINSLIIWNLILILIYFLLYKYLKKYISVNGG